MNDLISRQAAIDALRMDISIIPFAKAREYVREAIETIYNRLEELPSAQQEIIYCKDCSYRNKYRFPPKYDERDYCEKHEKTVQLDGYCSWAERRQDESEKL